MNDTGRYIGAFRELGHWQKHIKPSEWFNHKSGKFKQNKRKGK